MTPEPPGGPADGSDLIELFDDEGNLIGVYDRKRRRMTNEPHELDDDDAE